MRGGLPGWKPLDRSQPGPGWGAGQDGQVRSRGNPTGAASGAPRPRGGDRPPGFTPAPSACPGGPVPLTPLLTEPSGPQAAPRQASDSACPTPSISSQASHPEPLTALPTVFASPLQGKPSSHPEPQASFQTTLDSPAPHPAVSRSHPSMPPSTPYASPSAKPSHHSCDPSSSPGQQPQRVPL